MKKSIFTLLVLSVMLIYAVAFAQGKKYEFFLGGGIASPLSPDQFNDTYKLGFNGQFSANYFIADHFTLGGNLAYNRLAVDKDFLMPTHSNEQISGGNLSIFEVAGVGKYYFMQPTRATNFYILGGPGLAFSTVSDLKVKNPDGTTTTTSFDNETDFMLTGGLGITHQLNSRWSIFAEGRYSYIFAKKSSDEFTNGKNPSYLPIRVGVIF